MQLTRGRLLQPCCWLELLDHAVQAVLMRGGNRQKLDADAGGPGPAYRGIVDHNRLRFAWDMQLHGQLHAGKGVEDALHAAALGRKVPDRSLMAGAALVHQGAGERHREPGMFSRNHNCNCAPIGSSAMIVFWRRSPLKGYPAPGGLSTQSTRAAGSWLIYSRADASMSSNGKILASGCEGQLVAGDRPGHPARFGKGLWTVVHIPSF